MIDKGSKILILPEDVALMDIFTINSCGKKRSILTADKTVLEVVEVVGRSPFDVSKSPLTPSSEAVKSILLEFNDGKGFCLQNPNILIATNFCMVYFFAAVFNTHATFSSRYQDLFDLKDQLLELDVIDGWNSAIDDEFQKALNISCLSIEDGGRTFFKFSKQHFFIFLKKKVEELTTFILNSKDLNLHVTIKSSLHSTHEPPHDILWAQTLLFAADLILLSYFEPDFKKDFLETLGYDFQKLRNFLKQTKAQVEKDTHLENPKVNSSSKTTSKQSRGKKGAKVAVGNGALDHFFKKS